MTDINKWYEEGQKHKTAPLPKRTPVEKSKVRHGLKQIDKKYKNKVLENIKR